MIVDKCNVNVMLEESTNVEDNLIVNYQRLWKKVIWQNYIDAINKSRSRRDQTYKMRAIKWFEDDDGEFTVVCNLAGFDAQYVKKHIEISLNFRPTNLSETEQYMDVIMDE